MPGDARALLFTARVTTQQQMAVPSIKRASLLAGNHQIQNMNVRNGSSLVSREEEREIQMSSDDHNH